MIDLANETPLSLSEASHQVPRGRDRSKRIHTSTIYRWCTKGVRGERLEAVRVGGLLVTSCEALNRFFHRLNAGEDGAASYATAAHKRQREREIKQAERKLSAKGI